MRGTHDRGVEQDADHGKRGREFQQRIVHLPDDGSREEKEGRAKRGRGEEQQMAQAGGVGREAGKQPCLRDVAEHHCQIAEEDHPERQDERGQHAHQQHPDVTGDPIGVQEMQLAPHVILPGGAVLRQNVLSATMFWKRNSIGLGYRIARSFSSRR